MKRIACVIALGLFSSFTFAQDVTGVKGWIEDATTHKPGTSSADVKKNISAGAKYVFVDDAGKRVWVIDNPDAVKGHEGHHVALNGGMDKVAMTVHINSITMLKDQKPGAAAAAVGHDAPPGL